MGIYCATHSVVHFSLIKRKLILYWTKNEFGYLKIFISIDSIFINSKKMCFNINDLSDGLINSTHSNWRFVNLEKCQQSVNSLVIENFKCKWIISEKIRFINGLKCDNFFLLRCHYHRCLTGTFCESVMCVKRFTQRKAVKYDKSTLIAINELKNSYMHHMAPNYWMTSFNILWNFLFLSCISKVNCLITSET